MPQVCSCCVHEKRRDIDKALVAGNSLRDLARRFGPSKDALHRHRDCISAALEKAGLASALTARSVMFDLVRDLRDMALDCKSGGDREMFLRTADRLTRASESYGKLTGEIQAATVQAFLAQLGVQSEGEVRDALHLTRSAQAPPLEECLEEGVALVRMVLAERPEWRERTMARLGSGAEVVSDATAVENVPSAAVRANGHRNGNGNTHA